MAEKRLPLLDGLDKVPARHEMDISGVIVSVEQRNEGLHCVLQVVKRHMNIFARKRSCGKRPFRGHSSLLFITVKDIDKVHDSYLPVCATCVGSFVDGGEDSLLIYIRIASGHYHALAKRLQFRCDLAC